MIGTDLITIKVSKSNKFISMQDDLSLLLGYGDHALAIEFSKFDGGFEIGNTLSKCLLATVMSKGLGIGGSLPSQR